MATSILTSVEMMDLLPSKDSCIIQSYVNNEQLMKYLEILTPSNYALIHSFLSNGLGLKKYPHEYRNLVNLMAEIAPKVIQFAGYKMVMKKGRYREFLYRNQILDISFKTGGLACTELDSMIDKLPIIEMFRHIYRKCANKQLVISNYGLFVSFPKNLPQDMHRDASELTSHSLYTPLPSLITILIALTSQQCDTTQKTTTGSTVFQLFSHIPEHLLKTKKTNANVQIVMDKGDMIVFGGSLMHFGGAYNFKAKDQRILGYIVLQVNGFKDKNMEKQKQLPSVLLPSKYNVIRKDNKVVVQPLRLAQRQ